MTMRLIFAFIGALFLFTACEDVPDCALDKEASCDQKVDSPSAKSFNNEPYEVLKASGREKLGDYYQVHEVLSPYHYPAGTVIIDTPNRVLYLMADKGLARRYPIAVGKEGYSFAGHAEVGRKVKWPEWRPTPDMVEEDPSLEEVYEPGPKNPLGARAIYLYSNGRDTLYRIHGTSSPRSIGRSASSGCIRMFNEDVIDLYNRIPIGSNVVVIGKDNGEEIDIISDKDLVEEIDDPVYDYFTGRKSFEDAFSDFLKNGRDNNADDEAEDDS